MVIYDCNLYFFDPIGKKWQLSVKDQDKWNNSFKLFYSHHHFFLCLNNLIFLPSITLLHLFKWFLNDLFNNLKKRSFHLIQGCFCADKITGETETHSIQKIFSLNCFALILRMGPSKNSFWDIFYFSFFWILLFQRNFLYFVARHLNLYLDVYDI